MAKKRKKTAEHVTTPVSPAPLPPALGARASRRRMLNWLCIVKVDVGQRIRREAFDPSQAVSA